MELKNRCGNCGACQVLPFRDFGRVASRRKCSEKDEWVDADTPACDKWRPSVEEPKEITRREGGLI